MKYFPFFLQLNKLPCLVVGGGSVAERKLELLIKANADITVVSIEFTDYILELSKKHGIRPHRQHHQIRFDFPDFLVFLVFSIFQFLDF